MFSTMANPSLGVAAMMSALPLLIPLVIALMRKVTGDGGNAVVSAILLAAPDAPVVRQRYRPRETGDRHRPRAGGSRSGSILVAIWTVTSRSTTWC